MSAWVSCRARGPECMPCVRVCALQEGLCACVRACARCNSSLFGGSGRAGRTAFGRDGGWARARHRGGQCSSRRAGMHATQRTCMLQQPPALAVSPPGVAAGVCLSARRVWDRCLLPCCALCCVVPACVLACLLGSGFACPACLHAPTRSHAPCAPRYHNSSQTTQVACLPVACAASRRSLLCCVAIGALCCFVAVHGGRAAAVPQHTTHGAMCAPRSRSDTSRRRRGRRTALPAQYASEPAVGGWARVEACCWPCVDVWRDCLLVAGGLCVYVCVCVLSLCCSCAPKHQSLCRSCAPKHRARHQAQSARRQCGGNTAEHPEGARAG
jgi:hypothetical protein